MTKFPFGARYESPFGKFSLAKRIPATKSSFCRIRVFHYVKQNFGTPTSFRDEIPNSDVVETEVFDIQSHIAGININKSISNPSATFQVSLLPAENWKIKISPGDWVAIFLYSSYRAGSIDPRDTKNLVLLGNIDRIERSLTKDEETDKLTLRYNILGRNFGKVFETTDIWYDPYTNQREVQDISLREAGLPLVGNPTEMINAISDIFLGPGYQFPEVIRRDVGAFGGQAVYKRTSPLGQWKIPNSLAILLGLPNNPIIPGEPLFYDVLRKETEDDLPGNKVRNMITLTDNGSVWDMLERSSNHIINELFLEEVRDATGAAYPTLVLRVRPLQTPFFEQNFGDETNVISELNGAHKTMQELSGESFIEISQAEILFENLGKEDSSRINMFYMSTRADTDHIRNDAAMLNIDGVIGNPHVVRESIERHGLRRYEQLLEFIVPAKERQGQVETRIFKAFMGQLYDMNFANHLYEVGTIECTGILEAELGKVLVVASNTEEEVKKIYYIEGYQHTWQFPNTWRTVFNVTHGQFQSNSKPFIDVSGADGGQRDHSLDSIYRAKTVVDKDQQSDTKKFRFE